jgi:hypothetical protein
MNGFFEWLLDTPYAHWVHESWGWPIALTFHAFGTATIVGLMAIIALRMLGLFRTIPYSSVSRLIPFIWVALVVQVLSGLTLWITKPAQYLADGMFEVKMIFVVASIIVTVIFQRIVNGEAAKWDAGKEASPRGARFAAATCVLWACVTVGGRLTAYLGSLYPS